MTTATQIEPECHICGIPADASYFDDSSIVAEPNANRPAVVLAKYALHPNYCGELQYFAQFTDDYAANPAAVLTPTLEWQIRSDGQPLAPWLTFGRIINPWGLTGFPIHIRLREGCLLEFVVRDRQSDAALVLVDRGNVFPRGVIIDAPGAISVLGRLPGPRMSREWILLKNNPHLRKINGQLFDDRLRLLAVRALEIAELHHRRHRFVWAAGRTGGSA